jgi:hypothetical protein
MASHFQWYPASEEVVVPFNARYSFPTQANKAVKVTPRVPPVSGTTFTPTSGPIRITLPAQGYMNPRNTTLSFDVTLTGGTTGDNELTRFQNNIQSIFQRARLMYGSTPLEDIPNYNVIVRQLTEWTGTNQIMTMDQSSINEGIGGVTYGNQVHGSKLPGIQGMVTANCPATGRSAYVTMNSGTNQSSLVGDDIYSQSAQPYAAVWDASVAATVAKDINVALNGQSLVSTRQKYIQGLDYTNGPVGANLILKNGLTNQGGVPNTILSGTNQFSCTRRYTVRLALGLFNQEKLIPLKWMASQLTVELTLAPAASCLFNRIAPTAGTPTYSVSNVNLIPEILEFDASYDAMFLKGLREGGVPIKFSSWHTFAYNASGLNTINFVIPEKSRSVKSVFTIQRRGTDLITTDSGAAFFASGTNSDVANFATASALGTLQSYQYRVGGRYFPAAPVQCSLTPSSTHSNGGAEALMELQKALNTMGDSRLSVSINSTRWAIPNILCRTFNTATIVVPYPSTFNKNNSNGAGAGTQYSLAVPAIILNEADYSGGEFGRWDIISNGASYGAVGGIPQSTADLYGDAWMVVPPAVSNIGSTQFCAAIDLETSSGLEISGLNAEEQSDIAFIAQYSSNQSTNAILEAYVYYDAMLVLRENNVIELIQ